MWSRARLDFWRSVVLLAALAMAASTRAEMPPQPNAGASLVVDGVVREMFRSVRTTTIDYVFLIEVSSAKLGGNPQFPYSGLVPKPGDRIYVHAFQRTPDAPQIPGPGGYRSLPAEGSVIVAYLYPINGSGWQFAYPLGFEQKGRVGADDFGPLTPQPARPMPPDGPAPVALVPPRRLGVQVAAIVIANQSGLRITMVLPGSAAARAGLVPGDVILKANGLATNEVSKLTDQLVSSGPRLPLVVRHAATGLEDVVEIDFGPVR